MGQVDGIELLAHRGHLLYQSHIILALIVRTGSQFIIQDFYFPFHFLQVGKGHRSLFKYRTPVFRHQMLWQISYHTILRSRDTSSRRLPHPRQYFQ